MPSKHQPDFSYLRHVPLRKVHLFTLVQITCLAVLWTLKSTFLAIIFPVMVGKHLVELLKASGWRCRPSAAKSGRSRPGSDVLFNRPSC